MREGFYQEVKQWIYENARYIDICLWKYFFENGSKEEVVNALMNYQNDDGGFGHALEADNWNPNSSPITTQHALKILKQIDFFEMDHPIYQGIWQYLNSEKDLLDYGWRFTIPSNDDYPHAPWWSYSEESNKKEYFGVTAELAAFILLYGDKDSRLYKKAIAFKNKLFKELLLESGYGDMGISAYITLLETARTMNFVEDDVDKLTEILAEKIRDSIEYDTEKWKDYGVRPSNYINSPENIFYQDNKEIMDKEIQYLIDTKPTDDVWGITWTWFWNEDDKKSLKEFTISENWWKGFRAVENMLLLKNFKYI